MAIQTAERSSHLDPSENVIFQRHMVAYKKAAKLINGTVLEIGCGEGYGISELAKYSKKYIGVDKFDTSISEKIMTENDIVFHKMEIPPLLNIESNSIDFVVTFQVIEHIQNDNFFLEEIHRVLKPGGMLLLTTPNKLMSLSRNPWHIREYTSEELVALASKHFSNIEIKGVSGNKKVKQYYMDNVKSVEKFKRLDIFNLEKNLPNFLYKIPYEILNRFNRDSLKKNDSGLVSSIVSSDYILSDDKPDNLDLFLILKK